MNKPLQGRAILSAEAIAAAANGGVEIASEHDGPSLFTGIALEVQEIILCRNGLDGPCAQLRAAMTSRHEAAVKQAADDIAKIAGQMQTLSGHLSTVMARHMARKAQV